MMAPRNGNAPAGTEANPEHTARQLHADSTANDCFMCEAPDFAEARRYLTLLDESAEHFAFRVFDDDAERSEQSKASHPHGKDPRARTYNGPFDNLAGIMAKANADRCGVFVVVNAGGQKKDAITRVRAVFADADGAALEPILACSLEPHFIVNTSPGKWHVYWLVDGLPLDQFKGVQLTIAQRFGTDASVHDLPRVLRLPGFDHHKGAPHRVRVIRESGGLPYSADAITAEFPPALVAQVATAQSAAPDGSGIVVDVGRHDDSLRFTGRMARAVVDGGMSEAGAWAVIKAEVDRGRWTRAMPELRREFDDALRKIRSGEFPTTPRRMPTPTDVAALVANAKGNGKLQNTRFLPEFPVELLTLPHGMGDLQAWILGYMTYPSSAAAGFTALAALSHFAMPHLRINSREGLGFNEQYLLLAPTGFGKEDLRKPFGKLADQLTAMPPPAGGNLWLSGLARLQYSAPASQQGLHRLLEQHPAQTFLADEFAEWLGHAASDSHKQQALGYIMQAYSKAFETMAVPAIGNKEAPYVPVKHPRVLVFATSTAERMLETMTASQADSGAINRFVILMAEQERIAKRYDVTAAHYVPPAGVVDLVAWMVQLRDDNAVIEFSAEARAFEQEHDSMVLEPLRFDDRHLAGRLNEQALKMAALIALSDRRTTVHRDDLAIAYGIREGLYHRAAALIGADGALSGMHATGRAHSQLATAFENHAQLYRSALPKMSRAYRGLSEAERATVVRALIEDGYCARHPTHTGTLVSEVCKAKAA